MTEPTLEIRGIVTPKRRWPIFLVAGTIAAAMALSGGSAAYATYYKDRILPHTAIGNLEAGGMTPQQLEKQLDTNCKELALTISSDSNYRFSPADLGIPCDAKATVSAAMKANQNLRDILKSTVVIRRIEAITTRHTISKTDSDQSALQIARKLTTQLANTSGNNNLVKDPSIFFDSNTNQFQVAKGKSGKGIDPATLQAAALEVWENQNNVTLEPEFTTVAPVTPSATLTQSVNQANELISPQVYLIGRGIGHAIPLVEKAKWVEFSDAENNAPQISVSAVKSWLDTFSKENIDVKTEPGERKVTPDGHLITLTKVAWDSQKTSNNHELARQITVALNEGHSYRGVFEMEYVTGVYNDVQVPGTSIPMPYQPKPGEKWISVDIENHTTTAWEGNKIVKGPIASVDGALPARTPVGRFTIQSKHTMTRMKGEGWDGEYDNMVPFAMYYYGGYAIHAAPWRGNFLYTPYGGSHGCTNLPTAWAEELFNWASIGTPVIVHRNGVI